MNRKFNGNFDKVTKKGMHSQAAKQAFADIRKDKSMRVHMEICGIEELCSIILTEDILYIEY